MAQQRCCRQQLQQLGKRSWGPPPLAVAGPHAAAAAAGAATVSAAEAASFAGTAVGDSLQGARAQPAYANRRVPQQQQ
jgi:hypothetical protein